MEMPAFLKRDKDRKQTAQRVLSLEARQDREARRIIKSCRKMLARERKRVAAQRRKAKRRKQ